MLPRQSDSEYISTNAVDRAYQRGLRQGMRDARQLHADVHRCEDCGDPTSLVIGSYWLAADEVWAEVVGDDSIVLCPLCFHERAAALGILVSWHAVREDSEPADASART